MRIAVLGAGHIGSTVGRLWHAAGHDVTFAARDAAGPQALAEELGERAHAATVARHRPALVPGLPAPGRCLLGLRSPRADRLRHPDRSALRRLHRTSALG